MEKDSAQCVVEKEVAGSTVPSSEESKLKELTRLKAVWVIWEQAQPLDKTTKGQVEEEYKKNLRQIAEFGDLITFWQLWNKIPHSNPAELFMTYDIENRTLVQPLYFYFCL